MSYPGLLSIKIGANATKILVNKKVPIQTELRLLELN